MRKLILIKIIILSTFFSGCSSVLNEIASPGGAAAGAGIGYAINKKNPWVSMFGAAGGSILASSIADKGKKSIQHSFDMGYIQGNADSIKRHYWMCQSLHQKFSRNEKISYLSIPAPTVTVDGRNLVPHNVMVPIVE